MQILQINVNWNILRKTTICIRIQNIPFKVLEINVINTQIYEFLFRFFLKLLK